MNFTVTVLGEVGAPGEYAVEGERTTILEIIGQAGDLSLYANRSNVLVIRETGDQREYGYVNMHDKGLFNSPYYFLNQNDVIYVEPIKQKAATISDFTARVIPWTTLAMTTLNLFIILGSL